LSVQGGFFFFLYLLFLIVLSAFINCRDYGIMVEGIVPESCKDEQFVVNAVLESFKCG
jgi:hypothetical protein